MQLSVAVGIFVFDCKLFIPANEIHCLWSMGLWGLPFEHHQHMVLMIKLRFWGNEVHDTREVRKKVLSLCFVIYNFYNNLPSFIRTNFSIWEMMGLETNRVF